MRRRGEGDGRRRGRSGQLQQRDVADRRVTVKAGTGDSFLPGVEAVMLRAGLQRRRRGDPATLEAEYFTEQIVMAVVVQDGHVLLRSRRGQHRRTS